MDKVLFWDFDGTLAYGSSWTKSLDIALQARGYQIDPDQIKKHLSRRSAEPVKVVFPWHTPEISYCEYTGEKWWAYMFEKMEPFYDHYEVAAQDRRAINQGLRASITDSRNHLLYEDSLATVQACLEIGYQNYILSNNYPELEEIVEKLGLAEFITSSLISANIGYEKPHPEIYKIALELAQDPQICYMIGDNPTADIEGGKAAGMKTILVHADNSGNADFYCRQLAEIPTLLVR